jgi:hypothetical protein
MVHPIKLLSIDLRLLLIIFNISSVCSGLRVERRYRHVKLNLNGICAPVGGQKNKNFALH